MLWVMHPPYLDGVIMIRAGTVEEADKNIQIKAHIFTRSKHPWVTLPDGVATHESWPEDMDAHWGEEGLKRLEAATKKAKEAKALAKNVVW
jgi:hypothetical protein